MKVLIHPGFHKTGTTSLQQFMLVNRAALAPWFDYYGKMDFRAAGAHARIFGTHPFPWRLLRFRLSLRRFLARLEPGRNIVISRETLSGALPGHRDWRGRVLQDYQAAAPVLANALRGEIRRRFGTDTQIVFLYTTRDREAWIESLHGHLLRSTPLALDFAGFRAQFPALLGPEQEARLMASYLAPDRVEVVSLEHSRDLPFGAATTVLDLMDVPKAARVPLVQSPKSNAGPSAALRNRFLNLNRQRLRPEPLHKEKKRLLKAERART
ncbi:MAG: hypothetical protein AAGE76_13825 [Pseudomonadota bacterium]